METLVQVVKPMVESAPVRELTSHAAYPRSGAPPRVGGLVRYDAAREHRPRLPPHERPRPADRGRGTRHDDPRRGRARVPRRRGRCDRGQRRATAGARSRRRWPSRPAAWPSPTAARSRPSRSRRMRARSLATCPSTTRRSTRVRWLRGDRDGTQAGPRLSPRPRRDRALDRLRAVGQLPRQHPGRARPVRAQAAAPPVRGLARALPARLGGLPVPRRTCPAPTRSAAADELATELDRAFEAAGPGNVAAFVAEPIVGRDAGCRRATRRLLAGDRGGLPPPRRAAHRRRGDDRVRPDRALVRARSLGRPAGHPDRRQGCLVGLLAVRLRRGVGRGPRRRRPVGPASSTASPTRTRRSGAAVAREVLRILEDESLVEASAVKGERLSALATAAFGEHPAVGEIRGRGLMVGIELVADRATREPFPRAARRHGVGRPGRARTRRPRLLGDRLRQRRGRRHDPARAAVRRDRRRAGADRGGPRRVDRARRRRRSAERAARAAGRTVSYAVRRFHPESTTAGVTREAIGPVRGLVPHR